MILWLSSEQDVAAIDTNNINNKEFYNKVRTYDNLIKNSDNLKEVDLIVKEELKLLKKILD